MPPIALPYLAAARAAGTDAESFLQAQLSADISSLGPGQASFACYCSPRGQVLGLLLVARDAEGFWVVGSAALLPSILQRLRLYVLRARVELTLAPEHSCYGAATGAEEASGTFQPRGTCLDYAIGSPAAEPDLAAAGAWKAAELRAGVAWLGPDTSERFIPQMLGFDGIGAVSFAKGCYPGQEIVARARYLGRVKRGPLRLEVAQRLEAAPGTALRLLAGADWLEGSLVDSVVTGAAGGSESTVLLVVAPVPESPVSKLEIDGARYRCATI